MRKSGGKCYDLLLFGSLLGWLRGFFKLGLCRMRPCVGVGQEVLSIRCQQEEGGPGPATSSSCGTLPRGGTKSGGFPLSQLIIQAGPMLIWCCWCVAPSDSLSSLCFVVSSIAGEASQCVGSYWWCLATAVGLDWVLNVPGICLRGWEPMSKQAKARERIMWLNWVRERQYLW